MNLKKCPKLITIIIINIVIEKINYYCFPCGRSALTSNEIRDTSQSAIPTPDHARTRKKTTGCI